MSLAIGDHIVKKVDGKVLTPEDEGHIEFEVMSTPRLRVEGNGDYLEVALRVVEYTYPVAEEPGELPPFGPGAH